MLTGSYVAMITPFTGDNKLNEKELERMINFQIEHGSAGIVPCGTTGESPTLSWEEHIRVIEMCAEIGKGKIEVMAGAGSNSTIEAIEATQHAQEVGADYALIVTPYYNKPTQEGIYQHFKAISENSDLGLVIYNIPGRSGVNITAETIERIAKLDGVVGIKEAAGDVNQASDIIVRTNGKLDLYSGDDTLTLPLLSVGAKGVVSVLANIVPDKLNKMIDLFFAGQLTEAIEIHKELFNLGRAMFVETNPIPVKEAMSLMGWDVGVPRLPLTRLEAHNREYLTKVLKEAGLL